MSLYEENEDFCYQKYLYHTNKYTKGYDLGLTGQEISEHRYSASMYFNLLSDEYKAVLKLQRPDQ